MVFINKEDVIFL